MKHIGLRYVRWVFLLASTLSGLAGCTAQSANKLADPAEARRALRLSLESWQSGVASTSLKENEPPIVVVDHQWRGGYQLVRYQLGADGHIGTSLRCQVQLALRNTKGKLLHKKAVYSVGTSPVLTVLREEDP
jgi:hypothetical protein